MQMHFDSGAASKLDTDGEMVEGNKGSSSVIICF